MSEQVWLIVHFKCGRFLSQNAYTHMGLFINKPMADT